MCEWNEEEEEDDGDGTKWGRWGESGVLVMQTLEAGGWCW